MNVKDIVLDELVKSFELQNKLANEDLSGWDKRTLNGKITAKRIAKDEVGKIELQYYKELISRSAPVFIYGTNPESIIKFTSVCKEFNVPVYNTNTLYDRLAVPVEANLGNRREFNSHSILMLVSEMAALGKELGMEYIQAPKMTGVCICETATETVTQVRNVIRNSETGDNLSKNYLEKTILKDALTNGFNKPSLAVVIVTASKEEAEGLSRGFLSGTGTAIDLSEATITNGLVSALVQKVKKSNKVNKEEIKENGEENGKVQ
jgi:hypothetical protein